MARNGCSSPPRGRRWLEMVARARPGAADGSKWPLEPAPEPQNTRRVPLEPAVEPQNPKGAGRACPGATACSKSAARAHSREVRSFLALEMAARKMLPLVCLLSASSFARRHLASCMLCTGSHYYIYIYIYIYISVGPPLGGATRLRGCAAILLSVVP